MIRTTEKINLELTFKVFNKNNFFKEENLYELLNI